MKKSVSLLIFFIILLSSFSFTAQAETSFYPDKNGAEIASYYLYNIENNYYMAEHEAGKIVSPSATAKMMTACIALESDTDLDKTVTVTEAMLEGVSGRKMGLKAGDRLSFLDLLYATVCGGYNDASQVLAYAVTGDVSKFIEIIAEINEIETKKAIAKITKLKSGSLKR